MSSITQKTLISIPLLISIVLGIVWITDIAAQAKINKSKISRQVKTVDKIYSKLEDIDKRLSRIEGKLESK